MSRQWQDAQVEARTDDAGTTFQLKNEDGRWARVRFRVNGTIDVTVGPEIYSLDGLWNNKPGHTSLSLSHRS